MKTATAGVVDAEPGLGWSPASALNRSLGPKLRTLAIGALVAAGYYFGARVGFVLTFQPDAISVLWIPNAILLAALLLTPPRLWWLILLAAFPAHWAAQSQSGVPLSMSLCWFISNCAEALIGAGTVRYFLRGAPQFRRLPEVAIFLLCAVVAGTFLSSFVDAAFVRWNHWGADGFWQLWRIRSSSNALAALTVAPLIITWVTSGIPALRKQTRARYLEGALLFLTLALVSAAVFYRFGSVGDPALLFLPVPFLLWAATRFGACGTSTAVCVVTFTAIWSAVRGHGPFASGLPEETARSLQTFLIVLSTPMLFLAAVIEERTKANETVHEREALSRGIINSLTSLIVLIDRSGEIIAANDAWRKSYRIGGVPQPGIDVGVNYLEVCRRAARAGDQSVREALTGIEDVLAGKVNEFRSEYPCLTPAGSLWFEMLVLQLQSAAGGVILSHTDITRRKRTELALRERDERISLAAESANLALWTIDYERRQSWMNDKGREIFGFAPNESLSREIFLARVHPDDRTMVDEAIEHARAAAKRFEIEYRLLRPDGEVRWLIARGRYVQEDEGEARKLMGVAIDLTERKQAEATTVLQRQELAHLSRVSSLGVLSGALAHELNQPLGIILSNAQAAQFLLESDTPDLGELQAIVSDIIKEDRRAGDVIKRLHALLRRGETAPRALDVNESVREVLRLTHSDLIGRGVTATTRLSEPLPHVLVESVQLQQVLLNLIINGCDAMAENDQAKRRLVVETYATEDEVCMAVRDRGSGLPEAVDAIFQPFHTTKAHGLGMGLAICRTLVTAHGGRLWAEPNEEQGAAFFVALPKAAQVL